MNTAASRARSRSASSNTITGFLPPSSKWSRLRWPPTEPGWPTRWPTRPRRRWPAMSGCSVRARLPAVSPNAVHHVEHAGRQAGVLRDLGQQAGRERAPLRRLVHHRAARGQRGGDLPGGQHERRVPRRDHPDRADGSPAGVVEVVGRRQGQPVGRGRGPVGEEPEVLRAPERGRRHEADGLPCVHRFHHRDLAGAGHDGVGHRVQHAFALLTGRSRQTSKLARAASAAVAMSAESPAATSPRCIPSMGEALANVSPDRLAVGSPPIKCGVGSAAKRARCRPAAARFSSKLAAVAMVRLLSAPVSRLEAGGPELQWVTHIWCG